MSNKKDDLLTFADWIAYHRKVETDPKWVLARLEKILRETAVETESGIAKVNSLSEKLEGEVQRLTKRALDVCPVCAGKGFVKNTHGVEQFCIPCNGTGQRQ